MKHKVKLVWNAFRYDMSSRHLEEFNVIKEDLIEDIEKAYKRKELKNMDDLENIIGHWALYHYFSKAEHEVCVTDLFGKDEFKVDVFWQINMNLDRLTEYIANEMQIFK